MEFVERCDVLYVPEGLGCIQAMEDTRYLSSIRRLAQLPSTWLRFALGRSSWGRRPAPARVVRDGNVLAGGGVTAGADFALSLIAELRGPDVAQCVQLALEYAPAPPFDAGRPESAPEHIRAAVIAQMDGLLSDGRERVKVLAGRIA